MKKKTYVLIISEEFPQTHKRKGEPTYFVNKIGGLWEKIHTIRANYELWEKRIAEINAGRAVLSVRVWEGKPYRSKQREVFAFQSVGLEKFIFPINAFSPKYTKDQIGFMTVKELAKNDGLSFGDFEEWFKGYDLTKPMAIIHFSDFRYSKP